MTKPNFTEIIAIIDRSGSMQNIASDMEGGFDSFIAEQRKLPGECRVTLVRFDDEYTVDYTAKPISEVEPLNLVPRRSTALFDAVGKTIAATGERLAAMREDDRPEKVIVLIITDGCENASTEYRRADVADMIKHQRERYSWSFTFLGANQDALTVGASLNIPKSSSVTFDTSTRGVRATTSVLNHTVGNLRSGNLAPDASELYAKALSESK